MSAIITPGGLPQYMFIFQGENLALLDALWPDASQVMVGDELCREVKVENTEITCLPPESEPFDSTADNSRVRVG